MNEQREKYIILLLGASSKPIPSMWHIQKELFILTKFNPKVQSLFNFEKHYQGPYSQSLQALIEEPAHHEDAYTYDQRGYRLTEFGKVIYEGIISEYKTNEKFTELLNALRMIREMYDPLSKDELLFLVYVTYPEFAEASQEYDRLVNDKHNRLRLARGLFARGVVTEERYQELIGETIA
jgi:hypothetical protein